MMNMMLILLRIQETIDRLNTVGDSRRSNYIRTSVLWKGDTLRHETIAERIYTSFSKDKVPWDS